MICRIFKFVVLTIAPAVAFAGPLTMTYEGYLTDNVSAPITGPQNFVFAIYGSSSGNSPGGACLLYTETDNSVAVTAGVVAIDIGQNLGTIHGGYSTLDKIFARSTISGSGCTFSATNSDATWTMSVTVNGTALGSLALNAAPRAMQAQNSYSTEKIQGFTVSSSTPNTNDVLKYSGGIWVPSAESVTSESDPTVSSFAKGTSLGTGLANNSGVISLIKTCANGEVLAWNGTAWACSAPAAGGLSSTLAAGKIFIGDVSNVASPVAVSGDATLNSSGVLTLVNTVTAGTYGSVTVDSKGRVTSGTNPAAGDFLKDGSVAMTGDLQLYSSRLYGGNSASGNLTLESTSNATKGALFLNPNGGNVGIGTTVPGYPLEVNGTVSVKNGTGRLNLKSAPSSTTTFQFPSTIGSNGYVLQTDGTGITSWVTPPGVTGVTTGASNFLTTLGVSAGAFGPTGLNNTLIGGNAGYALTTGNANTVVGAGAAYSASTGSFNTSLGYDAGSSATSATGNTMVGANAGNTSTGSYNVIVGHTAGQGSNAGGYNVTIGYGAGGSSQDGTNNICLGRGAVMTTGVNNSIAIGYGVTLSASNIVAIGNSTQTLTRLNGSAVGTGTYAVSVGTSGTNGNGAGLTIAGIWSNASDRRIKHDVLDLTYGLGELMRLRPVQYKMIGTDEKQIGFIAQEVYDVVPEVVVKPPTEEGRWTMSYGNLTSLAIKGIQEQQREISSLKEENLQLKAVLCKYHPEEGLCH